MSADITKKLIKSQLAFILVNCFTETLSGTTPSLRGDINPLTTNVPYHIETSQLICNVNQFTRFYMMRTLVVNGLNFTYKYYRSYI